jgi:uncharacterized damage-inducible protein DinB
MTRVRVGSEKEILLAFLDQQREVLLWMLKGLDGDQVRQRPLRDSRLYLLGLVKHVAAAEQYWLCEIFGGTPEPVSLAASDDVEVDDDDTIDSVLAYFARASAVSDRTIAELDLDTTATTWLDDTVSLRWAILHVIEEAARHAGHADLVREHIDNRAGHLPRSLLPY